MENIKRLKTGVAYYGNRMLSHAIADMKDIARCDMDIVAVVPIDAHADRGNIGLLIDSELNGKIVGGIVVHLWLLHVITAALPRSRRRLELTAGDKGAQHYESQKKGDYSFKFKHSSSPFSASWQTDP